MSAKFIEVDLGNAGRKFLSLDNISSIEPAGTITKIILREIKNGNNVQLYSAESYDSFRIRFNSVLNS